MGKTANKRIKVQMPAGIRNKMMAAVSMLLVSAVMVVSTSYAWFTLSTAPEVTGITTNVGANGNLEMMLLTGYTNASNLVEGSFYSSDPDLGVVSDVGQSIATTQDVTESNITWGNLVDLGDGSYGLNNIVLTPARLNLTKALVDGANHTIGTTLLYAPTYGSDGRVVDVNTATYTGKANGQQFIYDDVHRGVRVIGTTTDVSQRLAAYRSAKGAVTTNANAAKNLATASLMQNGQSLANILVGYVADQSTTYTNADLKVLKNVLTSLKNANDSVAEAIKNVVLAYSLSDAQGAEKTLSDSDVVDMQTKMQAVGTITGIDSFNSVPNVLIPVGVDVAITTYVATENKINSAITELNKLNANLDESNDAEGEYAYSAISPILNDIVNKSNVEIAGKQDLGFDDIQFVIDEFSAKGSITMTMLDGSGVYADIAKMVGNYSVSGLKVTVKYNGLTPTISVTMNTKVEGDGIPQITTISLANPPKESGQAANSVLSNTYGYALDFGFRTNAASSDLQLQTAAVNRVYSDEDDTTLNTQGSGSFMQFISSDVQNFTAKDVLALMSAIRVAFVEPTNTGADILAIGALDITTSFDEAAQKTVYTPGSSVIALDASEELVDDIESSDAAGYRAGLYLHEFTVGTSTDKKDVVVLGKKLDDEAAITALTQNTASKITVIVYLDGDIVDNTMVANANTSMEGMLNLQFSSSATLAPMENTGMRAGGETGQPITYVPVAGGNTGVTSYTVGSYTGTVNDGCTIAKGSNGSTYYSTDGGTTYTKLTESNYMNAITVTTN